MNQSTKTRIRATVVVVLLAAIGTLSCEWAGARKANKALTDGNAALTQQLQVQTDSTGLYKRSLAAANTQLIACADTTKRLRSSLGTTRRDARKTHASLDTALVTLASTQKQLDIARAAGPVVVHDTVMVSGPERIVTVTNTVHDTVTRIVMKSRSVFVPEWGKGLWAVTGFAAGFGTGWILGENSATSTVYIQQSRSMFSIFTLRF